LLVVVPLVVALASGFIYLKGGRFVETDNAYIKADKVPISAEVSGNIKQVLVSENQQVTAGQILFLIDPAPFTVEVAKAEAKLAQVRTDLAALKASYKEKEAELALARSSYDYSLKDQQRLNDLIAKKFISTSQYDSAKQTTDLAGLKVAAVKEDLKRIAATLGGSLETPVESHPSFLAAQAELDQAELNLAHTEIRASLAGTVSTPPKPGQYTTTGSTTMALVASNDLWIEANFTETDLTYVHQGQSVDVRIDTYPGKVWKASVQSLSPATGAEFSIIPAQNATGNWVKIAQRVPVRIKLDDADDLPQLRAGLSTEVEIDTGHRRRLLGITL
jgi:membrane fusion protein (multidrug efflux system)